MSHRNGQKGIGDAIYQKNTGNDVTVIVPEKMPGM